jgi:hypothetical protein
MAGRSEKLPKKYSANAPSLGVTANRDTKICSSRLTFFFEIGMLRNLVASVAQLVEQLTLNQLVVGSSPPRGTIFLHKLG